MKTIAVVLGLLLAAVPAASQSLGTWALKAPMPIAHDEVGVVAIGEKLYVEGGTMPGHRTINLNNVYDATTNTWQTRAPLPRDLTHVGIAAIGGYVYIVGGFSDPVLDHEGAVDTTYRYDPATDTWTMMAHLHQARGAIGVGSLDGKIYAIGGSTSNEKTVATAEVYDPAKNRWSFIAPLPRARDHLAVVGAFGRLHAIGGRFTGFTDLTGLHDVYDPATNTWQPAAPEPTARSSSAAALYKGLIVVDGGECNHGNAFTENEAYDPKTDSWTKLIPLPPPGGRHAFGAAAIGSLLYFAGGAKGCGGRDTTAELLTLSL
jgi:N-acetylneuraminic acid mutarotase